MSTALTVFGTLLILIGLWLGYEAMFMPIDLAGTVNFSLVQSQTITFALAATSFIAGVVLMVGACVVHSINRRNG